MDPDDDRSERDRKDEAKLFLRHQGFISALSLFGLAVFAAFPSVYVVLGAVVVVYGAAKVLDKRSESGERISCRNRTVLITGCDTGFGNALAKQLANIEVTVIAGCLNATAEGATRLKLHNPDRIHVIQMDVTRDDQVQHTLDYVNDVTNGEGLWGLVNNAGLNAMGDVELATMAQFERVTNINQLGMVRVTKTFLPLIRQQKGRIVNVTSVQGRLSTLYNAAYCMTKFAGETFSDILRQEMRKFGVQVVIIEPCNFGGVTDCLEMTRIKQDFKEMWKALPKEAKTTYGKEYVDYHVKAARQSIPTTCNDVSLVTNAMEAALFTCKPRPRYLVGGSNHWYDPCKIRGLIAPFCPEWFMDGLAIHDVRGFPTPEALIGQEED